jgi:hypothetical protein
MTGFDTILHVARMLSVTLMMFAVSCALSSFACVLASEAEEIILLRAIVMNRCLRTLSLATPMDVY